jgi:phosphonate transport system permease protein
MKAAESGLSGRSVWAWIAPIAVVAGCTAVLGPGAGWQSLNALAASAAVGAAVSALTSRGLVMPMLIVAALAWSAEKSDLRPGLLLENRGRAAEYVFGRGLSGGERSEIAAQAESTELLRLRGEARAVIEAELRLRPGEPRPEGFAEMVEARAVALRASIPALPWADRVTAAAERLASDRRGGFFPPETDPGALKQYGDALLETVAIAIWGTVIAVVAAAAAALFASERALAILFSGNTTLRVLGRRLGVFLSRRGFDACRGFNEFVLALIFVAILGLGPFAGVLALAVHTFGVLGKVFADAMETIRANEVEGVSATGAPAAHVLSFAVLPQVLPFMVSQSLLRLESNVRSASVLGLVGAGGIGFLIDAKLKAYQFQEVATMMIMVIVLVSLIDYFCGRVMARVA